MKDIMPYKGYVPEVEFSEESCKYVGKVAGIEAVIAFESESEDALVDSFHAAVDEYLAQCEAEGKNPEGFYKASYVSGLNAHWD